MRDDGELLVERDGALCTLVINRPEKRNFLTPGCLEGMAGVLKDLSGEGSVRVVIIRGAGERAFSAGYDIAALPVSPSTDLEASLKETPPLEQALLAIRNFPYPVIAMLNGDAYGGGCELAVGCDMRVAARSARMGMPPAKLGLSYPYHGIRRFLTVLGFSRTMEMFITGRSYGSESCLGMGLVNHVVEDKNLEPFTRDLALEIAENAPLALRGIKAALYRIAEYPEMSPEHEDEIKQRFIESLRSRDLKEGRTAFKERRKPRFEGR